MVNNLPKQAMNRHLFRHHGEIHRSPTLQEKIQYHDSLHEEECTHVHAPRNQQQIAEYVVRLFLEGEEQCG